MPLRVIHLALNNRAKASQESTEIWLEARGSAKTLITLSVFSMYT